MNRHSLCTAARETRPATCRVTTLALAAMATLSGGAMAAPPQTGYLEQAQTQASGLQIRSYGVPTTDINGKVGYWDVTVDLSVGTAGKPVTSATVTSSKRVTVNSNRLVAGTYTDNAGGTCSVITTTLPSGRQEASISCSKSPTYLNLTVNNGDIAGHPFELQLTSAGIGNIPGYRDYNWGVDGATTNNYAGCFYTNYVVAARQIGPQIVITRYAYDNISDCGLTLTQAP